MLYLLYNWGGGGRQVIFVVLNPFQSLFKDFVFFRLADEADFFPSPSPESIKLKQMLEANNDKENCGDNISGGELPKCLENGKEMKNKEKVMSETMRGGVYK